MASGLTETTPRCPRCGNSNSLRVDSEENMRICLKCGYRCDATTGKLLSEYRTKEGKEIDRLQKRVGELEQQLAEVEGYPGNAVDMLDLRNRVAELEEAIEDAYMAGYEAGKKTALTPPATKEGE